MLAELKRCNYLGNIDGILFLISIIAGKNKISRYEIQNRCALENNIEINFLGAIAFLLYLKLVVVGDMPYTVVPTDELNSMIGMNAKKIISTIVILCIDRLVEDGIFDKEDVTSFNVNKGKLTIKQSAFPLEYAAIRNFLITSGALDKEENGEICIGNNYENDWVSMMVIHREKLTLNEFLKRQEEQNKRGLEAEEFVLSLEKQRNPEKALKIKRISNFDVAAGYDIVSYQNANSDSYDRFIEVKCYIGTPHFFWSENEIDVAKIKGNKYVLCLVDYLRINEIEYIPEYIINPYIQILKGNKWLVNTSLYRIQKIWDGKQIKWSPSN